jgi:hypothetical protein
MLICLMRFKLIAGRYVLTCLMHKMYTAKLGDFPANLLINQGVMATLQERRM